MKLKRVKPKSKSELKKILKDYEGHYHLIDTSLIIDMSDLFYKSDIKDFSGIETWNVSNVQNMEFMFGYSDFNQDISNWKISSIETPSEILQIFAYSKYDKEIFKMYYDNFLDFKTKNEWDNNWFKLSEALLFGSNEDYDNYLKRKRERLEKAQ